jgi:YegS/Rv2252/BmrU family lipid kinase
MSSALLISNANAGSADLETMAAVAEILRDGFELVEVQTSGPDELRAALTDFHGDRVITAGGDGSLHLLLNVLADLGRLHDLAVGLVPLGTGNDFAAGLDIPEDPVAAARGYLGAAAQPMDLIAANDGERVVNAAHAGLGAVAAHKAQAAKQVAGRMAYPLGAIAAAATEDGYDVELVLDGVAISKGPMLMVLAANGPCLGGGARLCVGADPADGQIDVLVIEELPLHERAGLGIDIQRGTHLDRDDVHQWQGHRLTISGQPIDHNRDGELRYGLDDVTYTIQRAAWHLLR